MTTIYTIGHSTRSISEFSTLLIRHDIQLFVDVRSYPSSELFPWFNKIPTGRRKVDDGKDENGKRKWKYVPDDSEPFGTWLPRYGVQYMHMPVLGGRRKKPPETVRPESIDGWEHPAFRNYAGYMQDVMFELGVNELLRHARGKRTAYGCKEACWWKCHRRMLSDALVARGVRVLHITDNGLVEHELTKFAKVHDGHVLYPADSHQTVLSI